MNKKVALVALVALIIGGVAWYAFGQDDQSTTTDSTEQLQVEQSPANIEPADGEQAQPIEEIELMALNGFEATGTATRTLSGKYVHTVSATIEPPSQGKFYEGWIVINPEEFISTGRLTQETSDEWSLTYSSEKDLSEYKLVVITEETEANGLDNIPETHVLEGTFN